MCLGTDSPLKKHGPHAPSTSTPTPTPTPTATPWSFSLRRFQTFRVKDVLRKFGYVNTVLYTGVTLLIFVAGRSYAASKNNEMYADIENHLDEYENAIQRSKQKKDKVVLQVDTHNTSGTTNSSSSRITSSSSSSSDIPSTQIMTKAETVTDDNDNTSTTSSGTSAGSSSSSSSSISPNAAALGFYPDRDDDDDFLQKMHCKEYDLKEASKRHKESQLGVAAAVVASAAAIAFYLNKGKGATANQVMHMRITMQAGAVLGLGALAVSDYTASRAKFENNKSIVQAVQK